MPSKENYQCYSIINNTDESIIGLNPILHQFEHELIKIKIGEFQTSFGELIPHDTHNNELIRFSRDNNVTKSFWEAIQQSSIIGSSEQNNGYVIILSNNNQVFPASTESSLATLSKQFAKTRNLTSNLIKQLRLFKSGDISSNASFIKGNDNSVILIKFSGPFVESDKFSMADSELSTFQLVFPENSDLQDYIILTSTNFDLSYNLMNNDLRYITLITCLEMLFNTKGGEISQTVSRHLALAVSKDKSCFLHNFNEAKKLYQHRNNIIHGSSKKTSLEQLRKLYEFVRQSINYCKNLNLTKDDLFDYLNSMGY